MKEIVQLCKDWLTDDDAPPMIKYCSVKVPC